MYVHIHTHDLTIAARTANGELICTGKNDGRFHAWVFDSKLALIGTYSAELGTYNPTQHFTRYPDRTRPPRIRQEGLTLIIDWGALRPTTACSAIQPSYTSSADAYSHLHTCVFSDSSPLNVLCKLSTLPRHTLTLPKFRRYLISHKVLMIEHLLVHDVCVVILTLAYSVCTRSYTDYCDDVTIA